MLQHGIMILNYRPKMIKSLLLNIGSYIRYASDKISKTLYVSLETNSFDNQNLFEIQKIVPKIYVEAYRRAPLLDIRVLHHNYYHNNNLFNKQQQQQKRSLQYCPEILFLNEQLKDDLLNEYLNKFNLNQLNIEKILLPQQQQQSESNELLDEESIESSNKLLSYDNVCIGGTFDNLHNGHKILLSTAQLKCNKKLTIGVTTNQMLKTKILNELIEPVDKRINNLNNYLNDIDPFIDYNICEIFDPYGPAIVDETIQTIIVSEETIRGAEKINEIRIEKNMKPLNIEIIKLLQDNHKDNDDNNVEEDKVSSSSLRLRKLGTLIKPPDTKPNLSKKPYLIGLTGMIASGKSSIAKKLQTLGAGIINVDNLAHKTYENSNLPAYKKIVETFGTDILDDNGKINRAKLGLIVFNDDKKLKLLNSFVWSEVRLLLQQEIDQMKNNYSVIVLEIALLIENNRYDQVHQVWLTILDETEVIRRLMERNKLNETDAKKRVEKLMPCSKKIPYANVIFCTKWSEEYTMKQVKRAWKMLNDNFINK